MLKSVLSYSLSIFLASIFFSGLKVDGGFASYVIIGLLLTIFSLFTDPIVKVITLPFNIITFGFLSFLTTFVSLFITTIFYKNLHVGSFVFAGGVFFGVHISRIYVSGLLSIVAFSATIYFLNKIISWIFKE